MARIDEIAPDCCAYPLPAIQSFRHRRRGAAAVPHQHAEDVSGSRDAVATLIDTAALRWISWSHFEVDECGVLNEWLAVAPNAQVICTPIVKRRESPRI
jgi:hypothetical protein